MFDVCRLLKRYVFYHTQENKPKPNALDQPKDTPSTERKKHHLQRKRATHPTQQNRQHILFCRVLHSIACMMM